MSGKFALIVGNTEYIDPGLAQLTAPGKDAEDFAYVLKDEDICAFDEVNVLLNPLSSTVLVAIDEFFDQRKPDDLLVLYFSGHGVRDEFGTLYLAVKNTNRSRLRSTAIRSDYIREAMDQSRSRRQVVVVDCCNSGAFPQGTKAEFGGTMGMVSALQGYGRFVLTASDSTQFAWEGNRIIGETQNSLFTHFLVKGLKGEADSDGDGRITVDELYDYAYEQISKLTPKQIPTKSTSKQEGEIILRQITRIQDIKPVPLPDRLVSEIENPYPEVRLRAVKQLANMLIGKNLGLARTARKTLETIIEEDDSRAVARRATQALESIRQKEKEPIVGEKTVRKIAERQSANSPAIMLKKSEKVPQEAIEKAKREIKRKETYPISEKCRQTYLALLNKTTHVPKLHYRPILLFSITVILIMMASMLLPLQLIPKTGSNPLPTGTRTARPTNTAESNVVSTSTQVRQNVLLPSTPPTETPACQTPNANVKSNNAYLRDGPDLRFATIGHYKNGDEFTVLGRYMEWFQVEAPDGNQGWLYKDWLSLPLNLDISNVCSIAEQQLLPTPQNVKKCQPDYYNSCN